MLSLQQSGQIKISLDPKNISALEHGYNDVQSLAAQEGRGMVTVLERASHPPEAICLGKREALAKTTSSTCRARWLGGRMRIGGKKTILLARGEAVVVGKGLKKVFRQSGQRVSRLQSRSPPATWNTTQRRQHRTSIV
jgi:hypothetical protein